MVIEKVVNDVRVVVINVVVIDVILKVNVVELNVKKYVNDNFCKLFEIINVNFVKNLVG